MRTRREDPLALRQSRVVARVALTSSALLLMSGCSTTSPTAVVADACSLLTEQQIETATRIDVQPDAVRVTTLPAPGGAKRSVCAWSDRFGEGMVELVVYPRDGRTVMSERRRLLLTEDELRAPEPVAVSGATGAFRIPSLGLLGMRLHDSYVQVRLVGGVFRPGDERRLATVVVRAWDQHAHPTS